MGRLKGSKNKPKDGSAPQASLPVEETSVQDDVFANSTATKFIKKNNVKVSYDETNRVLFTEVTAQDAFNIYETCTDKSMFPINWHKLEQFKEASQNHFAGGTSKEIIDAGQGKFNKEHFLKQREKLQKTFEKLDFLEAQIARKRSRHMSEYDGELDFDRLFDRTPFYSTRTDNSGIARTMDVYVDVSFSAGVNQEAINKFGATCWGITDLLEKAGIQCNVFIVNKTADASISDDGNKLPTTPNEYITHVKVKSSHEYIDTIDIARCFTTNFYRRANFNLWSTVNEALGRKMTYGLGRPKITDRAPKNEKGKMYLEITQTKNFEIDHESLAKFIKEAL